MSGAVLLDTCACIWLLQGERMTASSVTLIDLATSAGLLFVSPFTAWEVSQLAMVGR